MSRSFDAAAASGSTGFDPAPMQFNALAQVLCALHIALFALLSAACTRVAQHRQAGRLRRAHTRALLQQEMGWHDDHSHFELPARAAAQLAAVERALSQETMQLFENVGMVSVSLAIAFYVTWDVALAVLATTPLLALALGLLRRGVASSKARIGEAYAAAGALGAEALTAIRTVASLGLEGLTARRYETHLSRAEEVAVRQGWFDAAIFACAVAASSFFIAVGFVYAAFAMSREVLASAFPYSVSVRAAPLLRDAGLDALAERVANRSTELAYCAFDCGDPYAFTNLDFGSLLGIGRANGLGPTRRFYQMSSCANATRPLVPFMLTCSSAATIARNPNMLHLFSQSSAGGMKELVAARGSFFPCTYSLGDVVNALLAIYLAVGQLNMLLQNLDIIMAARRALVPLLATIRRHVPIDPYSAEGAIPLSVKGHIELRSVVFAYPAAPERLVCNGYSLEIPAGQMVALCGPSGGGKSTAIALIERFYDPLEGVVLLDGVDLRKLNVRWLRRQLGLVGQEPVLFTGSVADNIAYGCEGASQADVEEAARAANAHDFICGLTAGYDTPLGAGGGSLSGGQKQRIAIARAIIRRPAVLLLDEATSALDSKSERVVQAALDEIMAAEKRTTVAIAHRLSTIRNADKIAVIEHGRVVEEGTYEDLLDVKDGVFAALARRLGDTRASLIPGHAPGGGSRLSRVSSGTSLVVGHGSEIAPPEDLSCEPRQRRMRRASEEIALQPPRPSVFSMARRLLRMQGGVDRALILIGCCTAAVDGAVPATTSYFLTQMLVALVGQNPVRVIDDVLGAGALLFGVLVMQIAVCTLSLGSTSMVAHHLTRTLRSRAVRAFLRQPMTFFEEEGHSSSELSAFLEGNVGLAPSLTGEKLVVATRQVSTFVTCVYAIFRFGYWQLALVLFGCIPLFALAVSVQLVLRGLVGRASEGGAAVRDAGTAVLAECLGAIRTVAAFGLEQSFANRLAAESDAKSRALMMSAWLVALAVCFSRIVPNSTMGAALYYGSTLIEDDANELAAEVRGVVSSEATAEAAYVFSDPGTGCVEVHTEILLRRLLIPLVVTAQMGLAMGMVAQLATGTASAVEAAAMVVGCIDRLSPIDPLSEAGEVLPSVKGAMELRDLVFAYPAAPGRLVCNGYSLEIPAGRMVALCGPSGGGKSTAIALIERFYDPLEGVVLLDGVDLRKLNVRWLRRQLGLVGQEPVLFTGSVADNIAYGCEGASQADVEEAARAANAHDFICGLTAGYDTPLKAGGGSLSGGQKQRIAIARAIIRRPAVLLLDEATSALDSASEREVQAALDEIMAAEKRTTVAIAHRLSTIRNADKIAVIEHGRVVEEGTYDELTERGGAFALLVAAQDEE